VIVYSATRAEFTADVYSNFIEERILAAFEQRLGRRTSRREVDSWKNSMQYMNNVLLRSEIPGDAGVAVEYKVPLTAKRVDFILTGEDADRTETAVIVELKQWSAVEPTEKDAIVKTVLGGSMCEVLHPSYQAWTYAALIRDFNETVQNESIALRACAYLHNCDAGTAIKSERYRAHLEQAPTFVRGDVDALGDFLRRYIRHGDRSEILYRIDHGRLKPSKGLIDHLVGLLNGKEEFKLIDDQKIVYETALDLARKAKADDKQVLIVEGGPGTGKSVVAINLLVEATRRTLVTHYVTNNAAPRAVYESRLTGSFTKTHITNLFKGSGSYLDSTPNTMDLLIVDEAHRLNEKSGFYKNRGENQIKELISTAKSTVFFVDEDQRVTLRDIGTKAEIRAWAVRAGATVSELALESQFRCNGADGYLAWLNNLLQISTTAIDTLEGVDYDFRVCDTPSEVLESILEKNKNANRARLVAGYCWDWKGKRDPSIKDVVIPEHDFAMRWNLDSHGSLWLIAPNSVNEIGCIHTCQGLELDYVGVIIGPDFTVRDGRAVTDVGKRSGQDRSVRGYKKLLRTNPIVARDLADRVVKNTYRTLMTRGQKGCFVFCVDQETNRYVRERAMGSHQYERAAPFERSLVADTPVDGGQSG
jgi:DUF2075 family protein